MRARFLPLVLAAALAGAPAVAATTDADDTYGLIFRGGTLGDVDPGQTLVYDRAVTNQLDPEAAEAAAGEVTLSLAEGATDQAVLTFRHDTTEQSIGRFPAQTGNPIVMYFLESVVRDMAAAAGGSPFYIRNRVKAALVQPAELETREVTVDSEAVTVQQVTLRPFEGDPNAARMSGFDALTLTFTLSEAVPGWYRSLEARVGGRRWRADLFFGADVGGLICAASSRLPSSCPP